MEINIYSDNIRIWEETKEYIKNNKIIAQRSTKYKSLDIQLNKICDKTDLLIVDMDTLDAGIELKTRKYNPVVLNMSDWFVPGGCVDIGSSTQEEDLFRRSNYFTTLIKDLYPLQNIDTIYSKNIYVFKENSFNKIRYKKMTTPIFIDFIAAPAPVNPAKNNNRFTKQEDIDLFKNKMRMLLKVAYANGNDSIVLSAWGCGAFYCPSEHTAILFKEVLKEFNGMFKVFLFAIKNSNKSQENNNYNVFKKVLTS